MIYRILTDVGLYAEDAHGHWIRTSHGLVGAMQRLCDVMAELNLPAPDFDVPRARFYFTEHGWREVGRHLASAGRRRGIIVKVIRRKNPRRSQVVYRDALQVAILPDRGRRAGSGRAHPGKPPVTML